MNGFPGGATEDGSYFTDEGGAVFPAAFYEFAEFVVRPVHILE
jgi:hypothetical protein